MQAIGAKIQLDGEKQFKTGLQNIVQQSKTLAAEMKTLSSSFDKTATSQDKAKAKMDVLNRQIDVQKKYIDTLNGKYESQKAKLQEIATEYEKVAKEQGENSTEAQKLAEQYTRQETAISKTEEQINKAQTAYNNMERELQECKDAAKDAEVPVKTIGDRAKEAGEKMKAASEKVKAFGDKLSSAGKTLSTRVTAPIVAVAGKGVQAFAEVDKTMALTNKTMGNTSKEAGVLSDAMKNAASRSTFGMSDAATATLNFARAGLDAEQAAASLAPAMNLAAGEGGTLDTVSGGLVATINGFHGSFDEAGHYADVFAAACNNSALDVDSLSGAMSVAAPIFSSAGYSIEDAALYMGVMANNGIDADKAANSLKTGIARLVSPAKEGAEMMKKLGIEVTNSDGSMKDSVQLQEELHDAFANLSESEQIAAASAIFGKNQMAPWLALINTAPGDVNALNTSLDDCAGTTDEMAKAMMSGFGGSLEQLKSTLDVLVTTIGERLAPHISKFTAYLQGLADKFNALSPQQQDMIIKFAAIAAAIGPAILIAGKFTSAIGSIMGVGGKLLEAGPKVAKFGEKIAKFGPKLTKGIKAVGGAFKAVGAAIMAHPVIAIGVLIAGIIAALVTLYKKNEWFRNKVNAVLDTIKNKWADFKEFVKVAIDAIKAKIDEWHGKFTNAKNIIVNVMTAVKTDIQNKINAIKAAFDAFKQKVQTVVTAIQTAFNNMKAGIQTAINAAKSIVQTLADKVNAVKTNISTAINNIKSFFTNLKPKINKPDISAVTAIKDKIKEVVDKIKSFFTNLKLKIPKPTLPKLPHFKLKTGEKTLMGQTIKYPTGFSVEWYDKGGIFSSPSIIGVGEKRPEFVGALDDLRKIVREESGGSTINIVVNGAEGQDVRQLADIVYNKLNRQLQREGAYA